MYNNPTAAVVGTVSAPGNYQLQGFEQFSGKHEPGELVVTTDDYGHPEVLRRCGDLIETTFTIDGNVIIPQYTIGSYRKSDGEIVRRQFSCAQNDTLNKTKPTDVNLSSSSSLFANSSSLGSKSINSTETVIDSKQGQQPFSFR
jgi:hypothetical protein